MYDNEDDDCFESGYDESDDMAEKPQTIETTASEVEDKPLPPPPERTEPQRQRETRERDNPFKNARVRPLSAQMARKGIRMVLVVRNDGKAILYSGSK